MADKDLSARESALIAQARAELLKKPVSRAGPAAAAPGPPADGPKQAAQPPARTETVAPVAESKAAPAAAERIAALMAAARAETERERRRRKMLYVWVPFAFMAVTGMTTLLWMWHKL